MIKLPFVGTRWCASATVNPTRTRSTASLPNRIYKPNPFFSHLPGTGRVRPESIERLERRRMSSHDSVAARRSQFSFSFGLLVLSGALAFPQSTPTRHRITHEDIWLMKRVGAPVPSPDGRSVVFSVTEPAYDEKAQVSDLWTVRTDGRAKPRRLTHTAGGESGLAWGPDSRRLVFTAKREGDEVDQAYVMDMASGGEAVRVTSLSTGVSSPRWSPNGKTLLFVSRVFPGTADDEANKKIKRAVLNHPSRPMSPPRRGLNLTSRLRGLQFLWVATS
jgi:hypothetical protein